MSTHSPAQWSSRLAFILATIGCSVGLGNLWRFSAEAGSNGGGAFIVVYLLCVLLIGIPAIMAEFLIGRAGQASSSINSLGDLADRSKVSRLWNLGAWTGVIAGFLILSFYAVVAAWVMSYVPRFLSREFDDMSPQEIANQFSIMINDPISLLPYFLVFLALTIWLVARGVNKGLELASKVLMPIFFLLLVSLCIYSLVTGLASGGTAKAISFMFNPDFSKINGGVAVSALGQAFFSIGLGMSMMMAYGSYLPKSISIPQSALIVGLADTGVALIAGLAIFPIVFMYGLDFSAGAGLFFQTLPNAMISAPGGYLIGAAFFCMGIFAALTTGVALLEPGVAHAAEQLKITKAKAAIGVGAVCTVVGFGSLYSLEFMDFIDVKLTAAVLLPLSALLVVVFVGWRLDRAIIDSEMTDQDRALGNFLLIMLRYVAPVMIAVILVSGIQDKFF